MRPVAAVLMGVCVLIASSARASDPPVRDSGGPLRVHASLRPGAGGALAPRPGALPAGWRAHFPARDGDLVVATGPPTPRPAVGVDEVRREVVEPLLDAIGCPGLTLAAPAEGVRQARADAARLARAMRVPDGVGGREATRRLGGVATDLERQQIVYPFLQLHQGAPIQSGGLVVTRWEGQSPTAARGSVLCSVRVENARTLSAREAEEAAIAIVPARLGTDAEKPGTTVGPVVAVLRPVGVDEQRRFLLSHAYRMTLAVSRRAEPLLVDVWVDAETGGLLALAPLGGMPSADTPEVVAPARTVPALVWRRDPGVGTTIAEMDLDEPGPDGFVLSRAGAMARVRVLDGRPVGSAEPSFARPPFDEWPRAICARPDGPFHPLHQINLAATLLRAHAVASAQGLGWRIPLWQPSVGGGGCSSSNGLNFEHCDGYRHPRCPAGHRDDVDDDDFADGRNLLSWAEDNTVIVHEAAHAIVPALTHARPPGWCGAPPCALPRTWVGSFHDLADFWADHLEWTNCFGGWVGRNLHGPAASAACRRHSETRWVPRRHAVPVPFDPAAPGDHFPEHRRLHGTGDYSDGQIAAAALWEVRAGMLSIAGAEGVAQFGVRLQRALTLAGFGPETGDPGDATRYQMLYDLQAQLADQWATALEGTGGPRTLNKLAAGFARAGLFLIPLACLDGDPSTTEPTACPGRDHGGDAVIDVDDGDPSDDPRAEGVVHRESDYLKLRGRAPLFRVWTGPLYRFGPDGSAGTTTPSCNTRFLVEVSTDPGFRPAATVVSHWRPASRCHGTWRPTRMQWRRLQAAGPGARLYYRARTDAGWPGSERLSTAPGAGLWTVSAPYAVLTGNGRPAY